MEISMRSVYKEYISGEVRTPALKNINLDVEQGEFVVVLGSSGSGKSTLLNVSGGLDHVNKGEIMVGGQRITHLNPKELTHFRREQLGFVFQQYHLLPNMTVYENVEVGARLSKDPVDVTTILQEVMLAEHATKFPYQLSGGEQQRVAIARALAKKPLILFCDEPTGALDEETGKVILKILQKINQEFKTTLLLITHNRGISEMADKVVKMKSGEIINVRKNKVTKLASEVSWI